MISDLDTSKGMFDYPITVKIEVRREWTTCTVTQAGHSIAYAVKDGIVQYSAVPNGAEITIVPGGKPLAPMTGRPMATPSSPPAPATPPIRVIDDFDYANDSELNSAWWPLPCGNDARVFLDGEGSNDGMTYVYAGGDQGMSGRLRRNTSLDLSPYVYVSIKFKTSNRNDAITFQFMEAPDIDADGNINALGPAFLSATPLRAENAGNDWFDGTNPSRLLFDWFACLPHYPPKNCGHSAEQ